MDGTKSENVREEKKSTMLVSSEINPPSNGKSLSENRGWRFYVGGTIHAYIVIFLIIAIALIIDGFCFFLNLPLDPQTICTLRVRLETDLF